MKLVRYGPPGRERPGRLDTAGDVRDLSGVVDDIGGPTLSDAALATLREIPDETLPVVHAPRLGPCLTAIGKFIGVGLNYADHAREAGREIPSEPVLFMKAVSAVSGPNDDVERPRDATKLDYEVELGVVIGKRGKYVAVAEALGHVAGYCVVNDISERAFQSERGGQWTKGKSADTFGPIGPWLVTRDEVADPQSLALWLDVDGSPCQRGSTGNMIFSVADLISYVSRFMTLAPGDIIATGTPPGVGLGMRPPAYLQPGQVMKLGIAGLGEQSYRVTSAGS